MHVSRGGIQSGHVQVRDGQVDASLRGTVQHDVANKVQVLGYARVEHVGRVTVQKSANVKSLKRVLHHQCVSKVILQQTNHNKRYTASTHEQW